MREEFLSPEVQVQAGLFPSEFHGQDVRDSVGASGDASFSVGGPYSPERKSTNNGDDPKIF
jgi:hypothetical protein